MTVINMGHGQIGPELIARAKKTPGVINKAMKRSAMKARTKLARKTPKDLGQAKAGWKVSSLIKGTSRSRIDVYNDAPHVGVIELGARPHGVNLEGRIAIYEWVLRNIPREELIGPRRKGSRMKKLKNDQAMKITQAIVHKIRAHGQKPTYFVRSSMDEITAEFGKEVEKQISAYAKRKAKRGGGK